MGRPIGTAALMRADLWTYLSEDCLVKTDRASMAHGLEVRVPFLGNPVLDLVLGWPAEVHFDADGGKALLRADCPALAAGKPVESAQARLFGSAARIFQWPLAGRSATRYSSAQPSLRLS
jgi:asparagine synthase (glutamine-hydrolysing)